MTDMMQIEMKMEWSEMFDAAFGTGIREALVAGRIAELRREADRERTARLAANAGSGRRFTVSLRVRLGHAIAAAGAALAGDVEISHRREAGRSPGADAHRPTVSAH
ncbi:MAG: hypothetical protein M0Z49_09775 [Chloroflexi bacterium]|nr:hypothetical protein [Chloroflexota bacterium]